MNKIDPISPIDNRYAASTMPLSVIFGGNAVIKRRIFVEVQWLKFLSKIELAPKIPPGLSDYLDKGIYDSVESVKKIEESVKHDVKAIELYIASIIKNTDPKLAEFVHFACTSEDICNTAYALMVKDGVCVLRSKIQSITTYLQNLAEQYADLSMLSRTHGQAATPTTLGKEFANFAYRLGRQLKNIDNFQYLAKMNGAVGNFNAHCVAFPHIDWNNMSRIFLNSLGLSQNPYTTQIEPHDWLVEVTNCFSLINTILIGFCRDMWSYISIDYFRQKIINSEVGSSTMPHKINPIAFENAEGNLGLANSLFGYFSMKLPISRWQRDLSDSTVMRTIGVSFAHALVSYESIVNGLDRIIVNEFAIAEDLDKNWEVVAEPIQIILRKNGYSDSYNAIKDMTRVGHMITKSDIANIIDDLDISDEVKKMMYDLNPSTYIGIAKDLAAGIKAD